MLPVEIPAQKPLVYLQSLTNPEVCFVSLPVFIVDSGFRLHLSDDERSILQLNGDGDPTIGVDVLCLALLMPSLGTVRVESECACRHQPAQFARCSVRFRGYRRRLLPAGGERPVGERVLVLRRRAGEAITIGGDIEVEIMEISRTRVKLGVRAPRAISVLRRETIQVAAENREASEFIGRHGVDSIDQIVSLLRKSSPETAGRER